MTDKNKLRLPDDTQRLAILGRTGSGKTVAAAWHLSKRNFNEMPWVVIDFKYDPLLNDIENAKHIDTTEIPKRPGIYLVHPLPDDGAAVEAMMWKIWQQENIGVYIDEGYMVDNPAFRALLTQGRSKHIPMIVLAQRPSWITRFVFSESEFIQVFHLQDKRDVQTVQSFIPADLGVKLPEYHSYYHDVARDQTRVMLPVPEPSKILNVFNSKLATKKTFI